MCTVSTILSKQMLDSRLITKKYCFKKIRGRCVHKQPMFFLHTTKIVTWSADILGHVAQMIEHARGMRIDTPHLHFGFFPFFFTSLSIFIFYFLLAPLLDFVFFLKKNASSFSVLHFGFFLASFFTSFSIFLFWFSSSSIFRF